jgi:hypothetical protein
MQQRLLRPVMLLLLLALAAAAAATGAATTAARAAEGTTPPVEQMGNALIPAPDSLSSQPSVTVRVDFARPFKPGAVPLVVATPYFRRLEGPNAQRHAPDDGGGGDEPAPLLFAASTRAVDGTGFELHVERLDDRLPWRDAMVLVSWIGACMVSTGWGIMIRSRAPSDRNESTDHLTPLFVYQSAWDPEALSRSVAAGASQGGQVPVPPEPEDDFTGMRVWLIDR